jgi:ankyrin repeat protein
MTGFSINQLTIFAARSGNLELLKERIKVGGDINYHDQQFGSALSEAIKTSKLEIIDYLIENGVNVNISYSDDIGPLEIALRNPDIHVVYKLLCAGAKLKKKTRPYYKLRMEESLIEIKNYYKDFTLD